MVPDIKPKPTIGILTVTGKFLTNFKSFKGTVIAGHSKDMSLLVEKDNGKTVRVSLIPFLDILESLQIELSESESVRLRCFFLQGTIKGGKLPNINFPHKIGLLYLKKIKVSPNGIMVLRA
jgi:hypothetical protein